MTPIQNTEPVEDSNEAVVPAFVSAASAWQSCPVDIDSNSSSLFKIPFQKGQAFDFEMPAYHSSLYLKVSVGNKTLFDGAAWRFFQPPANRLRIKKTGNYTFEFQNRHYSARRVSFQYRRVFPAVMKGASHGHTRHR